MSEEAKRLAVSLETTGRGIVKLPDGNRLFLVTFDWDIAKGILLCHEGGGTLFWDRQTGMLTDKILEEAGFPDFDRDGVAQNLNAVVFQCAKWKRQRREQLDDG